MKSLSSFLLLFLAFGSLASFAQNNATILVEYHKTNPTYETTEHLYAQKQQALYVIQPENMTGGLKGKIDPNEDTHVMLSIKPKEIKSSRLLKKVDSQVILYEDFIGSKPYLITDSIPAMAWRLIPNESKLIGKYTCRKAELKFRGSNFVAFYTLDIPIPFGPWKFKGLPGLILEVYDKDMPYNSWVTEKISFPYTGEVQFSINNAGKEATTLRRFVDLVEQEDKKRFQVMRARIPKEATISNVKSVRTGAEKVYDWEKQD